MVRRGKRGHATLPRPFGPPGPPFSPTAGYVYRIRTLLYSSIDPAAERPSLFSPFQNWKRHEYK